MSKIIVWNFDNCKFGLDSITAGHKSGALHPMETVDLDSVQRNNEPSNCAGVKIVD
jgi:hypothetical protein